MYSLLFCSLPYLPGEVLLVFSGLNQRVVEGVGVPQVFSPSYWRFFVVITLFLASPAVEGEDRGTLSRLRKCANAWKRLGVDSVLVSAVLLFPQLLMCV